MRNQLAKYTFNGMDVQLDAVWYEGNASPNPPDEYEIYDDSGYCLNEGDPWFEEPTEAEIYAYLLKWHPEYEVEDFADFREEEDNEDWTPVRSVPKPRDL